MTYILTDLLGGKPIEIFTFSVGATFWRFTSSEKDVVVSGQTYKAKPIKRSSKKVSQNFSKNNMTINMSSDNLFLIQFMGAPPSHSASVLIQEYHQNDLDLEVVKIWSGVISTVKFTETEGILECESTSSTASRPVVIRNYQTGCPYILYGSQCKVLSATFSFQTTINAISSNELTLDGMTQADGYYSGGYITWNSGTLLETRFIVSHTGSTIKLDLPFYNIAFGDTVIIRPGCAHNVNDCVNKFNNIINYGGQPFYPEKNPIGGANVF